MNKVSLWFQEKWSNRVRQFGIQSALRQLLLATVRPVWQIKRNLIMAIPDHQPGVLPRHPEISAMTSLRVKKAFNRKQVNERQQAILQSFLADGCQGFLALIEGHLAGYAFIQSSGTYTFAGNGGLQIPNGMMVLKNLFVFPRFRGRSLGKKLNQARIASIPISQIPFVFVITENRFAIRNLKMYGFEEMLIITRTTWFKNWTSQRVSVINDCEITHHLIQGLKDKDYKTTRQNKEHYNLR